MAGFYAFALEPILSGSAVIKGLVYALLVWLANAFIVLPWIGEGIAGSGFLSAAGMIYFTVAHTSFSRCSRCSMRASRDEARRRAPPLLTSRPDWAAYRFTLCASPKGEAAMEPLIAGPLNAQCGKCLYWEQNENVATMGECRRYPPQVVMVREAGDAQNTASSEWPLTLAAAWCGEWIDQKYRTPQAGGD